MPYRCRADLFILHGTFIDVLPVTMVGGFSARPKVRILPQIGTDFDRPAALITAADAAIGGFKLLKLLGAPEGIRTSDLCLRRATLYPAELRARTQNPYKPCISRVLTPTIFCR